MACQFSTQDPKKKLTKEVWSPGHALTIMDRLIRDVFPWLGAKPVSEVKPVDILEVFRRVEGRGARWRRRTGSEQYAGRSYAMPWPPGAPKEMQRQTCGEHCNRHRKDTMRH